MSDVSILMMQKDEGSLLRHWLEFHSKVVPYQSIYVFDNGSSDRETGEILDGAKNAGVNIIQANRPTDFERKGAIFSKFIQSGAVDSWYVPLDCDEFLAIDSSSGPKFSPDLIGKAGHSP